MPYIISKTHSAVSENLTITSCCIHFWFRLDKALTVEMCIV